MTLRQIFARIANDSGWTSIADNQAARLAVRAYVEESRADGRPFREVIVDTLALTGAMSTMVAESARETITHWVVQAFYPMDSDAGGE